MDEARAAEIKPILVTPISRRYWQEDGKIHSDLLANVEAMKKVAADKNVPLMDLHQRAIEFYEKVGRPVTETWGLKKANPNLRTAANPDAIAKTVLDKTHFNPAGSRAIGKVVSDELKPAAPYRRDSSNECRCDWNRIIFSALHRLRQSGRFALGRLNASA